MNNVFDQRPEELHALEELRRLGGRSVHEPQLRFERAEELLRMNEIDDAVHLRIFVLRRALPSGELLEAGHEPRNKPFEEGHHDDELHPGES
jgi:hypothetical protein